MTFKKLKIKPKIKKVYKGVMTTIDFKKLNVPVKKNPFPDEKVEKW